jgi:hypothetical protein
MAFWSSLGGFFRYLYENPNTKWYLAVLLGFVAYMGKTSMDHGKRRREESDRDGRRSRRTWRDGE